MSRPSGSAPALVAAVATLAAVAVFELGVAASLPTSAGTLGAGTTTVSACDTNGFTFRHTIDTSGRITTVTVGSMDVGCAGGTLRVTLTNGTTGVGEGTVALPSVGFSGSAAVSMSPTPMS
ncbi:MAG: hypothetical protein ACRDFR_07055, partial [Candidatus Limnocylindria bacterium]